MELGHHHLKESNDMEELIAEYIKHLDDEIGAHIASAFFLHFNANVFSLVCACPNDFRREIQVNYERYYWCNELFLTVRKDWSDDGTKVTYKFIY